METISLKIPQNLQFTDDEFYDFCQANPELKLERTSTGKILIMALTGGQTGIKNTEIIAELTLWNRKDRLGVLFDSSTGFRLPNGAVRSPDAAWIRNERWLSLSDKEQEKFPLLCPDFVIELMSANDEAAQAKNKMEEWIANGCSLAWLIDPAKEITYVYRQGQEVEEIKGFGNKLSGDEILPGFVLDLKLLV
jgi:Uma2 family endonuclease